MLPCPPLLTRLAIPYHRNLSTIPRSLITILGSRVSQKRAGARGGGVMEEEEVVDGARAAMQALLPVRACVCLCVCVCVCVCVCQ